MESVMKPKQSLYYPISLSDIASANARVRQNSLREYSHAHDAAYRAFCRAPGRPQTAAFGRIYFATRLSRQSPLSSGSDLRECVVASRATVEERTDAMANNCHSAVKSVRCSLPIYNEQRLLSRSKSSRRTLRKPPVKSSDEATVDIDTFSHLLLDSEESLCIRTDDEMRDFSIEPDSSFTEKESATESSEVDRVMPSEDSSSENCERQLSVYHFVDNGCSCAVSSWSTDITVGHGPCHCDERFAVPFYSVDVQGEGYQTTPGLGHSGSTENKALWNLLQKQLSLSQQEHSGDDKSQHQDLESLNTVISRLINVKPPKGYLYYFAYGPDINTKRFMTYVHRKIEDAAWALLYGFKLTVPERQGCEWAAVWPTCKYSPLSAVEGRVYLVSRQEADELDKLNRKQGMVSVLLPVWIMDSDENACSTAQHCLPALIHIVD